MKAKVGKLTVIVGSMFSGKSTELQRQGRRLELAGYRVVYFKPKKDNRYTPTAISTHDGQDVNAYVVESPEDIVKIIGILEKDTNDLVEVVCIDEIQFFDKNIEKVIERLLRQGIDVIASGLDLDRFGEPFGVVPELMAKAENVIKLKAVCQNCGSDAWVSAGKFKSDEQIVVGEKESYVPLCRSCYYERGNLL